MRTGDPERAPAAAATLADVVFMGSGLGAVRRPGMTAVQLWARMKSRTRG
jgi:hypothetical protein